MSLLDSISGASSGAADALANPTDLLSMDVGESGLRSLRSQTGTVLGLYEEHKSIIRTNLGVPDAIADYAGDFSRFGIDSVTGNINDLAMDKFSSQISVAKEVADTANKTATTGAAATQALACLNIDVPEMPQAVTEMWDTVGEYAAKAGSYLQAGIDNCVQWVTNKLAGIDWNQFNPDDDSWLMKLYEKAKDCYAALVDVGNKIVNFVTSSELYQKAIEVSKAAIGKINETMAAVSGALACAPDVMNAVGASANVIAQHDPTMLEGVKAVNEEKANILSEASDMLDPNDDAAAEKLLGEKTSDIYSKAKKKVFETGGGKAAVQAASAQKGQFSDFLNNLNAVTLEV